MADEDNKQVNSVEDTVKYTVPVTWEIGLNNLVASTIMGIGIAGTMDNVFLGYTFPPELGKILTIVGATFYLGGRIYEHTKYARIRLEWELNNKDPSNINGIKKEVIDDVV
jgi:hypothetical protein